MLKKWKTLSRQEVHKNPYWTAYHDVFEKADGKQLASAMAFRTSRSTSNTVVLHTQGSPISLAYIGRNSII